jgi:gamma-glutamylcyclotransferase
VNDIWCFAYGSNLDVAQMEERTLEPVGETRRAQLFGYRIAFNKLSKKDNTGKGNLVPDNAATVWGVAYRCSLAGLKRMDSYERGYHRVTVQIICDTGTPIEAITYVADSPQAGLRPSREYLDSILKGARSHQLPGEYITSIEAEVQ